MVDILGYFPNLSFENGNLGVNYVVSHFLNAYRYQVTLYFVFIVIATAPIFFIAATSISLLNDSSWIY